MSRFTFAGAGAGAIPDFSQALSPPRYERKENGAAGSGNRGLNALRKQGAGRGDETSSVVSIANSLWGPPDVCWICGLPFDYYYEKPKEKNKERLYGDYAFTPNKKNLEESFWIKPSCNSTGQIIFDYNSSMPTGEHISQARIWEAICGFSFKVKNFKSYSPAQKLLSKAGLRWSHHFCNMVKNDINLITFKEGDDLPIPNQQRIDNLLNSIRSGRVRKHDGYQHHYDEPSCWTYSKIDEKIHFNFIRALLTTSVERDKWFEERRVHMYQTVNNLCELLKAFKSIQTHKEKKITIIKRIRHFLNTGEDLWKLNVKDDFFAIQRNIPYEHGKESVACNNSEEFLSEKLDIQKWTDGIHNTPRDTQKFNEQYQAFHKYKETRITKSRIDSSKSDYNDLSQQYKEKDIEQFPIIKKSNTRGRWIFNNENNNNKSKLPPPPPAIPRAHSSGDVGAAENSANNNDRINAELIHLGLDSNFNNICYIQKIILENISNENYIKVLKKAVDIITTNRELKPFEMECFQNLDEKFNITHTRGDHRTRKHRPRKTRKRNRNRKTRKV